MSPNPLTRGLRVGEIQAIALSIRPKAPISSVPPCQPPARKQRAHFLFVSWVLPNPAKKLQRQIALGRLKLIFRDPERHFFWKIRDSEAQARPAMERTLLPSLGKVS